MDPENNSSWSSRWCARIGRVLHISLCVFSAIYLSCFATLAAFAAGITIPNNSKLEVNTGIMDVDDVTVSSGGSLSITTGQIDVGGSWDVASGGTFAAGTSLVTFDGNASTQLLDSGGTSNPFYRLVHSGTQTLQLDTSDLDIDNNFTNSAGTFSGNGQDVLIAGDWTNTANFAHGNNTVTFDGTTQMITGANTWYSLTKSTTVADTLTFDNTSEQIIESIVTFNGTSGQLLSLRSDAGGSQWEINLRPGGGQDLRYLDVQDSNATGIAPNNDGLTLVARNSNNSGNNINWAFDGATITWDGSVDTDWDSPLNWDLGLVPDVLDTVVIPDVSGASGNNPVMPASGTVNVLQLTIQSGATLDANASDLTVSGTLIVATDGTFRLRGNDLSIGTNPATGLFSNEGNIELYGVTSQTVTFNGGASQDTDSGLYTYIGDGTGISQTRTIIDFGTTSYYDMRVNDVDVVKNTFRTGQNLTVANTLDISSGVMDISNGTDLLTVGATVTVDGGTLTATSGTIDFNSDFSMSSGVFTAPTTGGTFELAGSFTRTGGTYVHSEGQLTLDGTSQSINGSTIFWAFNKQVTSADTLTFEGGANTTIYDDLVLTGTSGNVLTIASSDSGTPTASLLSLVPGGSIEPTARGIQTISYVSVSDNDASNGLELIARNSASGDGGGNTNWDFDGTTITWDGSSSTDYGTQANWDKGVVPTIYDDVVVADTSSTTSNLPILDTGYFVDGLTINASASLTLSGNSFNITNTFSNNGTFILQGEETTTFGGGIDVDSGTFRYTGDADGAPDTITVKNFDQGGSAIDYYNLVINDTSAPSDTFSMGADLHVAADLTVTDGELTIGANVLDVDGNVLVNGGTLTASTATSGDIDGNMTLSSGSFTSTSNTLTLGGNWSVTSGTFVHNSGQVTLDGTGQAINGSTTFYTLNKNVTSADTLTFDNGGTQTFDGLINLTGTGAGSLLSLRSDSVGNQFDLDLEAGALQVIRNVDVQDSTAAGLTLVARSADSVDSGNNINWRFGNATLIWDGSSSTDWSGAANWDLGLVPIDGDTAIIVGQATAANQPTLTETAETGDLTLQDSDAILSLSGWTMNVTGTLSNAGTVEMQGDESLSIVTNDIDSGTFRFVGDGAGGDTSFSIADLDATSGLQFYDVVINAEADEDLLTTADTYIYGDLTITGGDFDISAGTDLLTVSGTLTTNGGTFRATNGNVDLNDSMTITSGSFIAPGSGQTFTLAGSFTNTGGGFVHSSGQVTFDTTTTAAINGNTTFYDFVSAVGGKQFTFESASTQTIANNFSLVGATNNLIVLRVSSDDTANAPDFTIDVSTRQTVNLVDVQNSQTTTANILCLNCENSGQNDDADPAPHWQFGDLQILAPATGKTIGQSPVLFGTGPTSENIYIRDITNAVIGTAQADANGYWRIDLGDQNHSLTGDATPSVTLTSPFQLALGANELTPYLSEDDAPGIVSENITVVTSPTTDQVPNIVSPADNTRVHGSTPTITGKGLAAQSATIWANDSAGNLLLTSVGTTSVDASGDYSVTLSTDLPKGVNYVSVVVDGVSSDIVTYTLTDPFGIVFDSSSNRPLKNAVVTIYRSADGALAELSTCDSNGNITTVRDLACDDTNPFTTEEDGLYYFLTASADYYITSEAVGYTYPSELDSFPEGRVIVAGSKGEVFTVGTAVIEMDHPMDGSPFLLRIEKTANKSEARIGDIVTYTITIENLSPYNAVNDFYIEDLMPGGFKYVAGRVLLDGVPSGEPIDIRPLNFPIPGIAAGATSVLRYQLVVGSGVTVGKYKNSARARYRDTGVVISNTASDEVSIVLDPLFDLGTVIGKVFLDRNENGRQDEPDYKYVDREEVVERGLPNVEIMMEDGAVITTDQNGLFSIPGLMPGRHLFRVVDRSLPEGAYLTTDKAMIVDITKGLASKVNFGVNIDNERLVAEDYLFFRDNVQFTQHQEAPQPQLHVATFQEEILMHDGIPLEQIEFRMFTNYAAFMDGWTLEIFDRGTKKPVRSFHGDRYNMSDPIYWDGRDQQGDFIDPRRKYAYHLTVEDARGDWDQTEERRLKIKQLNDKKREAWELERETPQQRLDRYQAWVKEQKKMDSLRKQSMLLDGERVSISRVNANVQAIRLYRDGQLYMDVPIPEKHGLTARELVTGEEQIQGTKEPIDFVLPKGEYTIEVVSPEAADDGVKAVVMDDGSVDTRFVSDAVDESGGFEPPDQVQPDKRYAKNFKVGEDYMTFVALGDAKIGYNFNSENVEEVTRSDEFKDGFWREGRVAYSLKGKIKGKYLIESSYDTDREQQAIFGGLDDDKYYPIYGDNSTIDRTAADTQGKLFLLVQWDKSEVIWGNYAVDLNDTEFAKFTRSMYGGKIEYETLKQTRYGDPRTKAVVFHANLQQLPAHNEFIATGGSLYYFKHNGVIEGSDIIKVEVRDAVTGLVKTTKEMVRGADYDIDYSEGRVLFWQPVSMIVQTGSIIDDGTLDGDPVYIIADYEYEVQDKLLEATRGARIQQAVNDNVVVGTTYVSETQGGQNYQLRGLDTTVYLGLDAKVKAEYADTLSEAGGNFISTDGGINFTEIATGSTERARAYGLSGDARLFNRVGAEAYYKNIENTFATAATTSQQGKELYGLDLTFDLTPVTRLTSSYDVQQLIDGGNVQTQIQVGGSKTTTTAMQLVHEARRLKITAEYRRQDVENRTLASDGDVNTVENLFAIQADYAVNERLDVTVKQQADLTNEGSQVTTVGAQARVTDGITLTAEQSFGDTGQATRVGAVANVTDNIKLKSELVESDGVRSVDSSMSVGGEVKLNDNLAIDTTYTVNQSTASGNTQTVKVTGKSKLSDKLAIDTSYAVTQGEGDALQEQTVQVVGSTNVTDNVALNTKVAVAKASDGRQTQTVGVGGKAKVEFDENTAVDTTVSLDSTSDGRLAQSVQFAGGTQVDDTSLKAGVSISDDGAVDSVSLTDITAEAIQALEDGQTRAAITVDETADGKDSSLVLADDRKLTETLRMVSERSFDIEGDDQTNKDKYALKRIKDGRETELSVARQLALKPTEVSRTNIYGLSGDIDDRTALQVAYERGRVQNLDGTRADRSVFSAGAGYVEQDSTTGEDRLKASIKVEYRLDKGDIDRQQWLIYQSAEGKINDATTVFSKLEFSETRNLNTDEIEADHQEVILGFAYRPIEFDRLNIIGSYSYRENQSPDGQEGAIQDVEGTKEHVMSVDAIYDINSKWQLAERFAMRITEEKVEGFEFTRTHTWLMVHRLNYFVDRDWKVSGEYRMLTQREAKDRKQGLLFEVTRSMGEFAELGFGYNFTDFSDDLSNLDYTSKGPFLRVTGKVYDRSPEERARAEARWLEERISRWAWKMVQDELREESSPVVEELNQLFYVAEVAQDLGRLEEAQQIYKDVIMAGQMMYEEAAAFIRSQIAFEEEMKETFERAQQYYEEGELIKARKLWQAIIEGALEGSEERK